MTYEYPKNFARFYDVIYYHQRDGVDHEFFLNAISQTRGKMLEVGVGTGRFFTDALNRGADVYGIDVSKSMIEVLKSKLDAAQHHRVSLQNIVDFRFDFRFDLIIAPFRVIMHVLEKDEQLKALNNVYRHLNPGGKFIFDTFVPDLKQLNKGFDNFKDFEGEYEPGKQLKRFVSTKPDLINQLINIHFHLEWDENNTVRHDDWRVPLRFFFRYELEHLIERSDFEQYRILGDFLGNELNETSKEFIVICQKK
jgi:SAM-dependent methyltransferase